MNKEQNKILKIVKEKILSIGGFILIDENEKAVALDFNGHAINLESCLDESKTFTTLFINDIQMVLTENNLLKKINFNNDELLDFDYKMSSIIVNDVPIEIYEIVYTIIEGLQTSKNFIYNSNGFTKNDNNSYIINFDSRGRGFSIVLEKMDLKYMVEENTEKVNNPALIEDIKTQTKLIDKLVNHYYKL